MKYFVLLWMFVFSVIVSNAQKDINGYLDVDHTQREYIIHLPTTYSNDHALPLVLIFHGGGGNDKQMQRYMGMDAIADEENFITVYPQGLNKQWNDGREFKGSISESNDTDFINQLLDTLEKSYAIDKKRIFATGISNGAFFSIYLSYKLNERLLAVAPVCGTIPQKVYDGFHLSKPVSVLLINGTGDPLVPYNGGTVGGKLLGDRGECSSTEMTIQKYLTEDKTDVKPVTKDLPNTDKLDGCHAIEYTYANGTGNSKVVLIKVINGGHTLPGGTQYLPKFLVGRVCKDFDANEMIWDFFKSCKPAD